MFTTLIVLAYCCSFVGSSSSVDSIRSEKYIDGSQHTVNSLDITYTQRVFDHDQCVVELNERNKILTEGELIKIKNKWFKVHECQLNRAYPVSCDSKFFYQLRDLACSIAEENSPDKIRVRQQTKDPLIQLLDRPYSNVCCKSACTISEFLQYCPTE